MTPSGCCGKPRRRRRQPKPDPLPPNPSVTDGVRLIYLGAGYARVVGSGTGYEYHVSSHERFFEAAEPDVDGILEDRDFMLDP